MTTAPQRLRALRKAQGLSQEELGRLLGFSGDAIKRYEWHSNPRHGRVPGSKAMLAIQAWSKALGDEIKPEEWREGVRVPHLCPTCGVVSMHNPTR